MSLLSVLRIFASSAFIVSTGMVAFEVPAFAIASNQAPVSSNLTESRLAPLIDAGFVSQAADGWYVDGPAVAAAAAGLRTVNSSQLGYDRDLFPHWSDGDGNGCDARNDILQRDLTNITLRPGDTCIVERGTLSDPYTGEVVPFTRGVETSGAVQIDHIVPLAVAWTGGADAWNPTEREAFANDPLNLQAVDGRANSAKGKRLPSEWMPANTAVHCIYLAQMTIVLKTYDLAVTPIDQDAIINGGTANEVTFAGVAACAVPGDEGAKPSSTPEASSSATSTSAASSSEELGTGADRFQAVTTVVERYWPWVLGAVGVTVAVVVVTHFNRRRGP